MTRLYGVLLVLISAVAFGTLAVLAPVAYNAGTNPISLLFLRFGIAGLAMAVYMIAKGAQFPRGKTLMGLILLGGVWYVVQTLAYFTALTTTSAGLVALLLYLYPTLVTLISAIAFRERVTVSKLISLGLALIGTILTIGPRGDGEVMGIALALTAALLYATYIVIGGRLMEKVRPITASTVIMLSAGVSYGGIVAVQGFLPPVDPGGWVAIFASAICSIVAIGTFFAGLERVGSSNASIMSTVEPFVTVGLAALLLQERIEPIRLVGGVFIVAAVVFLARIELSDD